jgi:hypothetical protein
MRCLLKHKKSYLEPVLKVAFFMRNFQEQVRVLKSGEDIWRALQNVTLKSYYTD